MERKHKQDTVRLTIDFPADQHVYLKMLAVKEGISLRQFVIEHLPSPHEEKEPRMKKEKFDKLLQEIIDEYKHELKSLSNR